MKTTDLKSNTGNKVVQQSLLYFLFIILALSPASVSAQADIHFSQFYETSILRNPALTGVFSDDFKLGLYYRNQWSSITNPYSTALFSAETHVQISSVSEDFVSFGLLGYSDKAGSIDQKITTFYPAINYNKCINADHNTFLSVGFTGGYMQYSFDPSKTTFNNQYLNNVFDPANPTMENLPNAKMSLWDLGTGVNYNTSTGEDNTATYVVGFSAYHFTQPKFSYYQKAGITENMRLNANGAASFNITDFIAMQLQGNYAIQGTYKEAVLGMMTTWTQQGTINMPRFAMGVGLFYRVGDALIPVVKVSYEKFALGISYDVNLSSLKEASNLQGGYELTLFYTGNYSDKGVTRKTVCPKF